LRDRQNLMILIAGPYRSGTDDDPEKMVATAPPVSQTLRALSQHPAFSEENAHARLHNDH
jgi:hypothetical protein